MTSSSSPTRHRTFFGGSLAGGSVVYRHRGARGFCGKITGTPKEIPSAFASRFLLTSAVLHPDKVPDSEDEHAVIPPELSARNGPRSLLYVAEYSTLSRISKLRSLESLSRCTPGVVSTAQPRTLTVLYASSKDNGKERARILYDGLGAASVRGFWLNDPHDREARERLAGTGAPGDSGDHP